MAKDQITAADMMPMGDYAKARKARRSEVARLKRQRRVEVGPFAVFAFECYETMRHHFHEMLLNENGGRDKLADELGAYDPLIPKGREPVATVMFEIDDPVRRRSVLGRLGGVEDTVFLKFDGERIAGIAETDVDRTTAAGKASAVQFIHFPFSDAQVAKFRSRGAEVVVGFDHPEYAHMAVMPEAVRATLAEDFD